MNRDFHSLVITLVTCMAILFYSCKSENQKYSEILESKDIELAYKFKAEHPNSTYSIDSIIQLLEYNKIRNSRDIQELNEFVKKFPISYLNDTVIAKMAQIEWDNIILSPNTDNVSSFMKKYSKTKYYASAENWIFENSHSGIFIDVRDGQTYNWVKIGTQIWMAENLKASTFRNGDWIQEIGSPINWQKENKNKIPAHKDFNSDYYYNWYAVSDSRVLAPEGWHIPSDTEWAILIDYLGEAPLLKMKSETGWGSFNGNNSSGFSAYPTGACTSNGYLMWIDECLYWSSTQSDITHYTEHSQIPYKLVYIYTSSGFVYFQRSTRSPDSGLVVRCIKN
jgi:uncharacterized protein (TIGR02145 family)